MSHLSEILNSREVRTAMRLNFAKRNLASISLSFNIPGSIKTNAEISLAFDHTVDMLKKFLLANRILTNNKESRQLIDAVGNFYLVPIAETLHNIKTVKSICERFEQTHFLNRIIDVDVVDKKGNPVSSGKAKTCFLCEKPATVCMRKQNHQLQDLVDFVNNEIIKFLNITKLDKVKNKLSAYATQALLFEVALSPKPGLVDRFGAGSHNDMDFFSFMNSTSALSAYWAKIVDLAFLNVQNKDSDELIPLRVIGIEMEQEMREFTCGINTHKGAIFVIGMIVYAVSKLIFLNKNLSDKNIKKELISLNKYNLNDELLKLKKHSANGKKVIKKYGINLGGGVRKEMSMGLPVIFNYALPVLKNAHLKNKNFMYSEISVQQALTNCLLIIISQNNDSNVLHRADEKTLQILKQKAKNCLKNLENFDNNYKDLCNFCINKNISPGGSADLLSATIFIYQVMELRSE